jgi:hypothetical protein
MLSLYTAQAPTVMGAYPCIFRAIIPQIKNTDFLSTPEEIGEIQIAAAIRKLFQVGNEVAEPGGDGFVVGRVFLV